MKTKLFVSLASLGALCLVHNSAAFTWREVPEPIVGASSIFSIAALSDRDVWTVGAYYNSGYLSLTEHWDGMAWSVVPSPNISGKQNFLLSLTTVSPRDVWACGDAVLHDVEQTFIEHWDGGQWSVVPSPNSSPDVPNYLWAMDAVAANDIWAVGQAGVGAQAVALAEHWDGASWTIVPTPPVVSPQLFGVHGITGQDVWAVGVSDNSTLTMH
jgi:hypothetical protein